MQKHFPINRLYVIPLLTTSCSLFAFFIVHEIMVGLERDNYFVNEGEEVEICIDIDHDSAVNSSFLKFNLSLRIGMVCFVNQTC